MDDVGLKEFFIGYRRGETVVVKEVRGDDPAARPTGDGTLLRADDSRLVVRTNKVWVRSGDGPAIMLAGKAVGSCSGRESCSGWGEMRLVGGRLIVPYLDVVTNGESIAVYDLASGRDVSGCGVPVLSSVVTSTGKVACGRWPVEGPQIVSEGVVLDAGPTVDAASLTRRGDQLVWRNGDVERTAPIPR